VALDPLEDSFVYIKPRDVESGHMAQEDRRVWRLPAGHILVAYLRVFELRVFRAQEHIRNARGAQRSKRVAHALRVLDALEPRVRKCVPQAQPTTPHTHVLRCRTELRERARKLRIRDVRHEATDPQLLVWGD
jgi:hypothetical protein